MKKMKFFISLMLAGVFASGCSDQIIEDKDSPSGYKTTGQEFSSSVSLDAPNLVWPSQQKTRAFDGRQTFNLTNIEGRMSAMIQYEAGKILSTNLMVAIRVPDTQGTPKTAVMYFNLPTEVKQQGNKYYMTLGREQVFHLLSPDKANDNGSVVRGMDKAFLDAFEKNKAKVEVYMAAISGGEFRAKRTGPNKALELYRSKGNSKAEASELYTYSYFPQLTQGNRFDTDVDSDVSYGTGLEIVSLRPGYKVPMQIPLTTGKWIKLSEPEKKVVYENGKWGLHLNGVELSLNPYGSLVGLVYDSDNESWINTLSIYPMSGDVSYPIDTNISFDINKLDAEDPITVEDAYRFDLPIEKPNANLTEKEHTKTIVVGGWNSNQNWPARRSSDNGYTGPADTQYKDLNHRFNPVFIWVHGKTGTFRFKVGKTKINRELKDFVEGSDWDVANSRAQWGYISYPDGGKGYIYGNQASQFETFEKTISNLENGKSYIVSMNTNLKEKINATKE